MQLIRFLLIPLNLNKKSTSPQSLKQKNASKLDFGRVYLHSEYPSPGLNS